MKRLWTALLLAAGCSTPASHPVLCAGGVATVPSESEIPLRETRTFDAGEEELPLIRAFVAPDAWGPEQQTALYVEDGRLVARHEPYVLESIDRVLRLLRKHRGRGIAFAGRLVTFPVSLLDSIENLTPDGTWLVGSLDPVEFLRLPEVSALPCNLTLPHGKLGTYELRNQFAYLAGYQNGDPIPQIVDAGAGFRIGAIANGTDELLLSLQFRFRVLHEDPPSVLSVRTAEVPGVQECAIERRFLLPRAQCLLLVTRGRGDRMIGLLVGADWQ